MSIAAFGPRDRALRLSDRWAGQLHGSSYVVMETAAMTRFLADLARRVIDALDHGVEGLTVLEGVGRSLVDSHLVERGVLERFLDAMRDEFDHCVDGYAAHHAIMTGYLNAMQERVRDEQEQVAASAVAALAEIDQQRWTSEARFAAVFAGSLVGIGIADAAGNVLEVNPSLCAMFGLAASEFVGRSVFGFVHPDDGPHIGQRIEMVLDGRIDHLRFDKSYQRSNGSSVFVDVSLTLIRGPGGQPEHVVGAVVDVTERAQLERRLRHEAEHDALTGLPNRALFLAALTTAVANDTAQGLCFLDLDGFKSVNDTLGHPAGDELLRTIADRLAKEAGAEGHLTARMGGDEFMVLVSRDSAVTVEEVAERVRAAVARPVVIDGREVFVTASLGVVDRGRGGGAEHMDATDLVKAADSTLYRAKHAGRRRAVTFDIGHHEESLVRSARSRRLADALDRSEFEMHFQPLARLADRRVAGVEALVRWRDRDDLLLPSTFVPLAEESGLIVPLGRWVLEQSCRTVVERLGVASDVFLSVNLSTRQLREDDLVPEVMRILGTTGWPASSLQLEITESDAMATSGREVEALCELADNGVRIAVDDFGTGYSNFAYLRWLPVHVLKLAGPFVTGQDDDGNPVEPGRHVPDGVDAAVLAHVIGLAHTLGLSVIAEHVETEDQEHQLRRLGCDLGQGWLYGRPGPAAESLGPLQVITGDRVRETRAG